MLYTSDCIPFTMVPVGVLSDDRSYDTPLGKVCEHGPNESAALTATTHMHAKSSTVDLKSAMMMCKRQYVE